MSHAGIKDSVLFLINPGSDIPGWYLPPQAAFTVYLLRTVWEEAMFAFHGTVRIEATENSADPLKCYVNRGYL